MKNGWVKYLVGTIVTLTLFVALPTLTRAIVENDKASRVRDEVLNDKIYRACVEQQKTNEKVSVELGKIATILEFIKMKVQ